jgi:ATP-dependent Clp protease ATP-binding subunit ClpC
LERAHDEARDLRHSFVGTEHLLLGLLYVPEGTAASVLGLFGLSHAQVRSEVVRMMGLGVEAPGGELSLTGRTEDVLDRARREASIRDQEVGTEHILLALIHERDGAAARILLQLDADPAAIRAALSS